MLSFASLGGGGARCALVLAWRRSRLPPHGRAFPFRPPPERRDLPGAARSETLEPRKGEDCPRNYRRRVSATNARGRRSGSAAKLCMVVFNARPGITCKARAATAFQELAGEVERQAGVRSHLGKLRAWSRGGGLAPPDLAALGPDVWTADKPPEENGIVVLGTPLGTDAFVAAHAQERMATEQRLLDEIALLDNVQCAWVMLLWSAVPRANHTIRILPPVLSHMYAVAHDATIWDTFCNILGAQHLRCDNMGYSIATLPARLGGLGLRSAERNASGAFWAS